MNWAHALEKLTWSGAGALLSLAIAYVTIGRDVAFIRGQLSHIIDAVKVVQGLKERSAVLESDVTKIKGDVRAAHEKIRILQRTR